MKRWPIRPLGELCDVRIGRTPRRDEPRFWGGDAVWVTIRDLNGGQIFSSKEMVSQAAVRECMPDPVPVGTLLFSFKLSIGKMAVAGCPLYTNEAIAALPIRDPSKLSREFLRYALLAESHEGTANMAVLGKVLNKEKVQQLPISVPALAEQEWIVKLLDEADELRKLRAQADRRTATLSPSLFHEMFGDPFTSPKGCSVVRICEAGRVQLGRQRAPKYQTGKFTHPYIRVANVYEDEIDVSDLLTMDFDERDFVQYRLEEGDILLNEGQSTELVGRPAMWRNEIADCCFQNTLVRFQPDRKRVLPDFALAVFLSYFRGGNFASISSKTSNVAHLGAARFAKMPFPLPPLPLQKEFAARVSDIRAMQADQAASRRRLDDLFQSMLHRAFNGEL
jgi:type I restriction enzyme S subunit